MQTWVGLLLALFFSVCVSVVVVWAEMVTKGIQIGFLQMPPVAIALLLVVLALNAVLKRISKGFELRKAQLLGIYFAMVMSAMVSSRGWVEMVVPLLISPAYSARPWDVTYFPYLRQWLVPFPVDGSRGAVVDGFFGGGSALSIKQWWSDYGKFSVKGLLFYGVPWNLWLVPLLAWSGVGLTAFFVMLCLASLLERQWIYYERLPFPLVRVPLALLGGEEHRSLTSVAGFLGILLPVLVLTLNGVAENVTWLPRLNLVPRLSGILPRGFGYVVFGISFSGIGFFYFVQGEVLWSLLLCFWLYKSSATVLKWFGFESLGRVSGLPAPVGYMVVGAYYVLSGYILFMALRGARSGGKRDSLLTPRVAIGGAIIGFVALCGWWIYFGMAHWASVFMNASYFFIECVIVSRAVAECGFLMTDINTYPHDALKPFIGSGVAPWTAIGLVFITVLFTRDLRGVPMTGFIDSCKLSDSMGLRKRSLIKYFWLGIVVPMLVACYLHLRIPYSIGASNLYRYPYIHPEWLMKLFRPWAEGNLTPETWGIGFIAGGGFITLAVIIARTFLPWLTFRPLALAVAPSWTMTVFWGCILVAWIIKSFVLRYGGNALFKKLSPFFIGMILGECSMAVLWTLLNIFFGWRTPQFAWL